MPRLHRRREAVEVGVIHRADPFRDRPVGIPAPLVIHVKTLEQGFLLGSNRIVELIEFVVLSRQHQPALVHRPARIEHPPINLGDARCLAHREHVTNSCGAPHNLGPVVLEHPVAMSQWCSKNQLLAGTPFCPGGILGVQQGGAARKSAGDRTDPLQKLTPGDKRNLRTHFWQESRWMRYGPLSVCDRPELGRVTWRTVPNESLVQTRPRSSVRSQCSLMKLFEALPLMVLSRSPAGDLISMA